MRQVSINEMYLQPNDCTYEDFDGSSEHSLFADTNFGDKESYIYNSNGFLSKIKSKVFNYVEEDLLLNNQSLYYKLFALWTQACQSDYTTLELTEQG